MEAVRTWSMAGQRGGCGEQRRFQKRERRHFRFIGWSHSTWGPLGLPEEFSAGDGVPGRYRGPSSLCISAGTEALLLR